MERVVSQKPGASVRVDEQPSEFRAASLGGVELVDSGWECVSGAGAWREARSMFEAELRGHARLSLRGVGVVLLLARHRHAAEVRHPLGGSAA
jgi:hypothetical protein